MSSLRSARPGLFGPLLAVAWLTSLGLSACDSDPSSSPPESPDASTESVGPTIATETASTWWEIPGRDNPTPSVSAAASPTAAAASSASAPRGQVLIDAGLDRTGSLVVTERVTFHGDPGTHMITVSVRPSAASGLADDFAPRIESLRINTEDEPLTIIDVGEDKVGFFPGNTETLVLRYRLDGVMQQSLPSSSGRALVYVTGVETSPASELPRTISVVGATNMGCAPPGEMMSVCGTEAGGAWTVTLSPEQSDHAVYAQVDADVAG